MIVDASALLSIVLGEDDRFSYYDALERSAGAVMSAVNYVEAGIRADRNPGDRGRFLDGLIAQFGISVVSVTPDMALAARVAYHRFGKGRHPARLNLGDCFAFALAKARGEPLLFKGNDFAHPDVLAEIGSAL